MRAGMLGSLVAAGALIGACRSVVVVETRGAGGTSANASTASSTATQTDPPPLDTVVATTTATSVDVATSTGSGPAGCYDPSGVVAFKTTPTAAVHQMVCSSAQISGFLSACVALSATQQACDGWMKDANNSKCQSCMLGDATLASPPALIVFATPDAQAFVVEDDAACEALVEGKANCGGVLASRLLCRASACLACQSTDEYAACVNQADADPGGCKPIAAMVSAECAAVGAKGLDPKCDGKDFLAKAMNVTTALCGI